MSKGELLIIGKLTLTFVVLLGIPLWELYGLRKDRLRRERMDTDESDRGAHARAEPHANITDHP